MYPKDSATYGYLANSRRVDHIVFHNGTEDVMRTSKQWDSLDRLTRIEHERLIHITAENPATILSYRYRYNLANQRYRVDEADGSYWVYEYDDLGQLTSGKKHFADDTLVPGWQFEYGYDDIGEPNEVRQPDPKWSGTKRSEVPTPREETKEGGHSVGGALRAATYESNSLNQYISRTVPGAVDVTSEAAADAEVYINRQPAWRKEAFYQGLVEAQNSAAPAYPEIRVDAIKAGAGPQGEDVASTSTGHAFIPETLEVFSYDDDGNMTHRCQFPILLVAREFQEYSAARELGRTYCGSARVQTRVNGRKRAASSAVRQGKWLAATPSCRTFASGKAPAALAANREACLVHNTFTTHWSTRSCPNWHQCRYKLAPMSLLPEEEGILQRSQIHLLILHSDGKFAS